MLEDIDKNAVDFRPNYDGTCDEPVVLPSKFPYLLCGNNSGIAVGMSSDLVSHNFTEVAAAINYYMEHKDCTISALMQFIKGPDFPTGGKIINGDDLINIYTTGRGAVKIQPHYDILTSGNKTLLVFHDIPYGVDIDSGIKAPLKKLVLEEGYEQFINIDVKKVGPHNFDILITLAKGADVAKSIDILFTKTRLSDSVKINQTVIINGEPRLLNLKQLIEYYVNTRSNIIKRIAQNDYNKTNHKLTVTIGLQKCMSNIDLLINLIRSSANKAAAKLAIKKEFELNDEQADAVLDMKLSRLSRLDLEELNSTERDLEQILAKLKNVIDNESERYKQISLDLAQIKKALGKDERLTEIIYHDPEVAQSADKPLVKREFYIYPNGIGAAQVGGKGNTLESGLVDAVMAYDSKDIWGYNKAGEIAPIHCNIDDAIIGAFVKDKDDDKLITVSKNGNIKVSLLSDYKLTRAERAVKIKDGDELLFAAAVNDKDFIILFNKETSHILKLSIADLTVATKLTVGVKSGFTTVDQASVGRNGNLLLTITSDNKGKFTNVSDFSVDSRGNKGQSITDNTICCKVFENGRTEVYLQPKVGKTMVSISKDKMSIKGKTAVGASIATRAISNII